MCRASTRNAALWLLLAAGCAREKRESDPTEASLTQPSAALETIGFFGPDILEALRARGEGRDPEFPQPFAW